jgi:hypothetical protein
LTVLACSGISSPGPAQSSGALALTMSIIPTCPFQ